MTVELGAKTALAIRHIHFEDLGVFAGVLGEAGYQIRYHEVGLDRFEDIEPQAADLLIVLGGPIGVYETDAYPFIEDELRLLKARLAEDLPTLGICLGAQLIASALGARVAPMGHKEIGFSALALSDAGRAGPLGRLENVRVLHWHGDAFEIPTRAQGLASTSLCATQAFALGPNILGLQFHPEVGTGSGIERWLVGHAAELAHAGIDPRTLREEAAAAAPALREAARLMLTDWLKGLRHGRP